MYCVGAAFGDNVYHAAAGPAVLCGVVGAVDLKLAHGLLPDGGAHAATAVVRFAAIHIYGVAAPVAAVERQAGIGGLFYAVAVGIGMGFGIGDARCQQAEGEVVAPVNWKVGNGLLLNYIRLLRPGGLYGRRFRDDVDGLRSAQRQPQVLRGFGTYLQGNAFHHGVPKAGGRSVQIIGAGWHKIEAIEAGGVTLRLSFEPGLRVRERNGCAGDHGVTRIRNGSAQRRGTV